MNGGTMIEFFINNICRSIYTYILFYFMLKEGYGSRKKNRFISEFNSKKTWQKI